MRVFIAGAGGAIGRPLVRQLVAAGHEVTGMTRRQERAEAIRVACGVGPGDAVFFAAGPHEEQAFETRFALFTPGRPNGNRLSPFTFSASTSSTLNGGLAITK